MQNDPLAAVQFDALYGTLHRIAAERMRRERSDHSLSATALMHEAYLSLARSADLPSEPAQFSALASHVVRNVLVNHAVARAAEKRGYGEPALSLTQTAALDVSTAASDAETIDVQALQRLDALMFTLGIEQQKAGSLGCF